MGCMRGIRRFVTLPSESKVLDINFMMNLMERKAEQLIKMTPEHWPDIQIKSAVYSIPRSGGDLVPASHLLQDATKTGGASVDSPMFGQSIEPSLSFSFLEDWHDDVSLGDGEAFSLDQVFNSKSASQSIDRIKNIIGSLSYVPRKNDGSEGPPQDRYIAYVDSINFGDLKSKSISSIVAKAYGFQSMAETGKSDCRANEDTTINTTSTAQPCIETEIENASKEEGSLSLESLSHLKTLASLPKAMPAVEKAEKGRIANILILGGADLRLLDLWLLKELGRLHHVDVSQTRAKMESRLCTIFTNVLKTEGRKSFIAILNKIGTEDGKIVPFSSVRRKNTDEWSGEWDKEMDDQLFQNAYQIKAARQQINEQVEAYLRQYGIKEEKQAEGASKEDSFWEVIAKEFPRGVTPKACQRRWMMLYRMRYMESSTDL